MVELKSRDDINIMYYGGQLLTEICKELKSLIRADISTLELEDNAKRLFKKKKLNPAFLNYNKFPATICTSINDEIVHGIPSADRILKDGDIISVDLGGIWRGFYIDMAFTTGVGVVKKKTQKMIEVTKKALKAGMSKMQVGNKLHDISWSIQRVAENSGFNVVRDLVGHGIGKKLHESPHIPNFGKKNTGMILKSGMVFAIEPMLTIGRYEINTKQDGWTVETKDGSLSSHFEDTIAITEKGFKCLTNVLQ